MIIRSLRVHLVSAAFKPLQGNPMFSRDQEPPSLRVVSLMGCNGEGFLGHLVVGAPPKNGEDLEKTREGIPG